MGQHILKNDSHQLKWEKGATFYKMASAVMEILLTVQSSPLFILKMCRSLALTWKFGSDSTWFE